MCFTFCFKLQNTNLFNRKAENALLDPQLVLMRHYKRRIKLITSHHNLKFKHHLKIFEFFKTVYRNRSKNVQKPAVNLRDCTVFIATQIFNHLKNVHKIYYTTYFILDFSILIL